MLFNDIVSLCDKTNVRYEIGAKTAPLTSIVVGKRAELVLFPRTMQELCKILDVVTSKGYKHFILGNGTNCYFCDNYDGIVIVTRELDEITVSGTEMRALCGASLKNCSELALLHSLAGLEFAHGIPGSVGGALYMNASAYGSSIGNFVESSLVYEKSSGRIIELSRKEHLFGEKSTVFSKTNNYVVLETRLKLLRGDFEKIKNQINDYDTRRQLYQPLDKKSAGSAFKKPKDTYASLLIDKAGLKGFSVGDAAVSTKHAGFIINKSNAGASQINELISHIKREVFEKFNILLEEEIIYIE